MSSKLSFPTARLNTGAQIPLVGLGTYRVQGDEGVEAITFALKSGYRHLDTAAIYNSESEVGKAIKLSGVPREEIFVTTKLWNHRKGDVRAALDESLVKLQLDYVDLYLIHWPQTTKDDKWEESSYLPYGSSPDFNEAWRQMSEIFREGKKVKAIGVSNFSLKTFTELFEKGGKDVVIPAVNQIELSPYLPQVDFLKWQADKGIHVTAWSPLGGQFEIPEGSVPLLQNPKVIDIAKRLDVSTGQVLISWGVKRGTSIIPKSSTHARIITNGTLVPLTEADIATLDSLSSDKGNPLRLAKGESKSKSIFGWTYADLGWEDRESL